MKTLNMKNIPAIGSMVQFSTMGFGRKHEQTAIVTGIVCPRELVAEFTVCIDGAHGGKRRWLTVDADGVKLENGADVQRVSATF